jgi:hypothetical protein
MMTAPVPVPDRPLLLEELVEQIKLARRQHCDQAVIDDLVEQYRQLRQES